MRAGAYVCVQEEGGGVRSRGALDWELECQGSLSRMLAP